MIGIIGAMEEEVAALKSEMADAKVTEFASMTFYKGTLCGKDAVVVRSGIGKVNAAICAQILVDKFGVDTLINTGVAGSLDADINIGDIVISTDAVQHDMDVSMLGDPVGQIPRMDTFSFPADEKLVKLAVEVNKEVNPDIQTFTGRVLSGDQFISGKEKTVEEFLHTFDELFHAHKTIVICADAAACDISNLDPRLAARLESGLTVELNLPDDNARLEILRSKRDRAGMNVSDEILEFLASRIQKSVRRLEGALLRVATFTSLSGDMPDIAKIEQLLRDILREETSRILTVDSIQKRVADFYELKVSDLTGKRRPNSIAFPRQIAMYLSRRLTERSLKDIGQAFGGRDHGTVIHANKLVASRMEEDVRVRDIVQRLEEELRD